MSSFAGALFLLAFAPFGVSILAAVSISYLFILCLTQPPKIVAQCYFCFGLILFVLGSGPVKGFALTLGVGILTTLFSVYFIARLMTSLYVIKNKHKEKLI